MIDAIRKIEIEDFIRILILELNEKEFIYFVDKYNGDYFYIDDNNKLCIHQLIYTYYDLYFQKVRIVHRNNLDKLEKYIYKLHRQLTFKIDRAEKGKYYYFINITFNIIKMQEQYEYIDNRLYNSFNYFLSKEEAEKYAKILQEELIKLRKEDYYNE